MSGPLEVRLSLISHTNVGKTTLARTLLRRDIGEVRDAAHVTEVAESHTLIEAQQGEALVLWDTPGFGDSARLALRLGQESNPLGWFLIQVWDRFRDRPLTINRGEPLPRGAGPLDPGGDQLAVDRRDAEPRRQSPSVARVSAQNMREQVLRMRRLSPVGDEGRDGFAVVGTHLARQD